MSTNEKEKTNEKDQIVSTLHFLDQLKNVIHKPSADIKKAIHFNCQNNIKSIEDNLKTEKFNDNISNISENNKEFHGIIGDNPANNKLNEYEIEIFDENNIKIEKSESMEISQSNNDNNENQERTDNNIENSETNTVKETTEESSTKEIINIINFDNVQDEKKINDMQKEEYSDNANATKEEKGEKNNIISDENGLNRQESKESKKSEKHKSCPSCLNKCMKWTIKAEIKSKHQCPKDFKSKYTFDGTSVFFKKLDYSILNILHNSISMTKLNNISNDLKNIDPQEMLEKIKNDSNNKLNNFPTNKIPSSPVKDNFTSSIREILNINYPIDNTKFNYSIIDANLCIKDNLKNIFLLEFDLDQLEEDLNEEINKENNDKDKDKEGTNQSVINSDLRAINDECVEKEIYFILNGEFHGNKIFKNDLTFSVEYREFIKSMQFRIQNYQNKLIEASKKNKNKKIQNIQSTFFGKVLTNINLGIEFSKPPTNEIMQTNFNSIVNSHIILNKILIELTIPNIFINNNKLNISNIFEGVDDTISTSKEKTSNNSPKKEDENKNNISNNQNDNYSYKNNYAKSNDNYNFMYNSNMTSPNVRTIGINRSIPASPHLNDFQKLIYQQKYSPLINNMRNNNMNINNNFSHPNQNSFFSSTPNYPRSPASGINLQQMFCSPQPNTYSPMSASLMMMQMPFMGRMMQQPMSMNSPFNTSNYSSPYMGMGLNKNNSGIHFSNQQRKNSENIPERIIIENSMNTIGKKIFNSNHQTPRILNRNEEDNVSKINLNQFMSPRSMGPTSSFNLSNMNSTPFNLNLNNPQYNAINGTYYQLNPMNNINQLNQMGNINNTTLTIRQKLFESVKKEEVDKINKTLNSMNRIRPNNNNNINNMTNINNVNNMANLNTINSFNNSNTNKNIRNNMNNINNFSMNSMKNLPNMHNIQNIPNKPNISNIPNIPNMNNFNKINNMNNMNRLDFNNGNNNNLNNDNEEKKEKLKIKNMFLMENQNLTNLDIFLKSITPLYKKDKGNDFLKLKIKNVFENLIPLSLRGLENTYYNQGELINVWYSLTLSSMSIKVTNKQLISQIFEEKKKNKKKSDSLILKEKEEISFVENFYTLYFTTEYMEISFTETKLVHFRKSYSQLIKYLMSSIPLFDKITIGDLNLNESFFAILYTSFRSTKHHVGHSSFVVYYHFTKEILQENRNGKVYNNEKYFKQTVVGLLPIKINSDFFFQRITLNNMMYKSSHIPLFGYYNNDTLFLRNMIYSIINQVTKYTRSHSYDYDLFIKLNKYNFNN